jgi:hypothetical protein
MKKPRTKRGSGYCGNAWVRAEPGVEAPDGRGRSLR